MTDRFPLILDSEPVIEDQPVRHTYDEEQLISNSYGSDMIDDTQSEEFVTDRRGGYYSSSVDGSLPSKNASHHKHDHLPKSDIADMASGQTAREKAREDIRAKKATIYMSADYPVSKKRPASSYASHDFSKERKAYERLHQAAQMLKQDRYILLLEKDIHSL